MYWSWANDRLQINANDMQAKKGQTKNRARTKDNTWAEDKVRVKARDKAGAKDRLKTRSNYSIRAKARGILRSRMGMNAQANTNSRGKLVRHSEGRSSEIHPETPPRSMLTIHNYIRH